MIDKQTQTLINQVTLHKLNYTRNLLERHNLPHSGNRERVRERLTEAIESQVLELLEIAELAEELDAWGDQRIRLTRLPYNILEKFQSYEAVEARAERVGMKGLLEGRIDLIPPQELTPMQILYEDSEVSKRLKLVAAKTRYVDEAEDDLESKTDENYPDIIWKPFREETQKAVCFAEIDLESGDAIISSTLLRRGGRYEAEFGELIKAFAQFLPLVDTEPVSLIEASRRIRFELSQEEVQLFTRTASTQSGGAINFRSHSPKVDIRADPELRQADELRPDAPCRVCNCWWEMRQCLQERVHTHIHAPEGEISILGQVKEDSVRYVLHRILELN